jgi:hypothetical protein
VWHSAAIEVRVLLHVCAPALLFVSLLLGPFFFLLLNLCLFSSCTHGTACARMAVLWGTGGAWLFCHGTSAALLRAHGAQRPPEVFLSPVSRFGCFLGYINTRRRGLAQLMHCPVAWQRLWQLEQKTPAVMCKVCLNLYLEMP